MRNLPILSLFVKITMRAKNSDREKESKNRLNARDMKREERQIYYYTSRNTGERKKVYCTRLDYLFLKLYYDIDGLSPDEYEEYKAATK